MLGGGSRESRAQFIKDEDDPLLNEAARGAVAHGGRDHTTALEQYLPEGTFGDWYHNTGIMVFCALSCWLVGRLGGGLAWIIVLGAFCGTYYRTSIRRVRRNARDDITRDLAKTRLETDFESAEWMNSFLTKFWVIYEPVLSGTIVATVDQVLATSTPAFLDSMRLAFFTLGTKPPRIDHVKTYPRSNDDIVLMDWRFSFTPNDTMDLTARQLQNKVNPRIELAIRVGLSVAAATLPIVVEDIAFSGLMQVKIKLMTEFPHIKIVDLSFLERPEIGYVLKPVGGKSLGFDIGFIPGLSGAILEMIHGTLAPMMYAPNVFSLNIEQMMSGAPIDSAIGVAVVTIHSAHGLRNPDIGSGKPDPYVTLGVGQGELARTEIIKSESEPRFNEAKTILLTTLKDPLSLEVFDFNEVRKDKSLGIATFDLSKLELDSEQEHISETLMSGGKSRGTVVFSISYFPVLTAPKLDDGTIGEVPDSDCGIVRFTVHQAKNLGGGKSCSPYAALTVNAKEVSKTPKMKHTNNPVWNYSKEVLITDKNKCALGVKVQSDDLGADSVLGAYQIKLLELLEQGKNEVDDFMLKNARDPQSKVKLSAIWKPVAMNGIVSGAGYAPPIGALRVEFKNAVGLRNPELGLTGGKADPYMRVLVNGSQRARTVTIKNEQNPEWNEVVYIPMKNIREKVTFEVMDYQQRTKDRSLGVIPLDTSRLLQQGPDGYYTEVVDKNQKVGHFTGKDAKGTLNYTVSFYPALNVMTKEEEEAADKQVEERRPVTATTNGKKSLEIAPAIRGSTELNRPRTTSTASTTAFSRKTNGPPKVRLSKDELMKHQSGFLVFELLEGRLSQSGCFLQVLFDDYYYPAYTTQKARSATAKWNETGEGFIRELDFSRITLRINKEADSHDEEHILAEAQDSSLNVLRRSYNEVISQTLKGRDGHTSTISYKCHFIPVALELEPTESVNNMGKLRIDIISGSKLCAADRGGKSDPYAKFLTSEHKDALYKTATIKKTLNPEWKESFECVVASRITSVFTVNVLDWDAVGEDDELGSAVIPLAQLQPMQSETMELPLDGPNGGNGKSGTVKLRVMFTPEFVARARRGTTRAFTIAPSSIAHAPTKAVGGAMSGVKKGGSFLGLGRRSGSTSSPSIIPTENGGAIVQDGNPPGPVPAITTTPPTDHTGIPVPPIPEKSNSRSNSMMRLAADGGLLTIKVLQASNMPDKKVLVKVRTRAGSSLGKTEPFKNGANVNAEIRGTVTMSDELEFALLEHHTLGSDKALADAVLPLTPDSMNTSAHTITFSNGAQLQVELSVQQSDAASVKSSRFKGSSPFRKSMSG